MSHETTEAATRPATRTRPVVWVLRAVISLHLVVVFGQPVFAGLFLSGDYGALAQHLDGANLVTGIGYAQLIVGIVVWRRVRVLWPLTASAGLAAAETLQYYLGMHGPLWLHIPLGVAIVAGVVVQFVMVWSRPPVRREPLSHDDAHVGGAA